MRTDSIQNEIINEFSLLENDMEMTLYYLMELGQKLPAMPDDQKTETNIVQGCQSKVWLTSDLQDDKVYFQADSNTAITKGLASLLVRVLSGQKPDYIVNAALYFPQEIKMDRFIGTQRTNGFAAMIQKMKMHALAYKNKVEAQ